MKISPRMMTLGLGISLALLELSVAPTVVLGAAPQGPCAFDSGPLDNSSGDEMTVWQQDLDNGLAATRLRFGPETRLPAGSRIRLTSMLDNEVQDLDAVSLATWRSTSAFFNGGRVRIELIAAAGTVGNRVVTSGCIETLAVALSSQPRTICGVDDDRSPSSNPAIGRLMLVLGSQATNCTGTIVDCPDDSGDKCHLTAAHCFDGSSEEVLEFEVPASRADCALVHPPVRKQFPVTGRVASVPVEGDDWAVFRVGRNSVGMTSFEEQGQALSLATTVPATGVVRITGYGVDSNGAGSGGGNAACGACVAANATGTRNSVQQTHTGDITSTSAAELFYRVDTCGNNSGSVIVLEATGEVVGVHAYGACGTASGANQGNRIDHAPLAQALGVCKTPHLLVLLDRTGSMSAVRANGHSRCRDAVELARQDVTSFFDRHETTAGVTAAVWTFADDAPVRVADFGSEAEALAAIDSLDPEGCGGITPLAEALCTTGDELVLRHLPAGAAALTLAVSSDGGENNSDGPCAGPWSLSGPPYDPGSWQRLVTEHLRESLVVQSRFWGAVTRTAAVDQETGALRGSGYPDDMFFEDLAAATGGTFQSVADDGALPPPFFGPGGGNGQNVLEVPTLGLGGLALLVLLVGTAAVWLLRKNG